MSRPARICSCILLSLAAIALSGCAALEDLVNKSAAARASAAPSLANRPRLDPISRNYFLLESLEQSVIGEPQIVFANADNTFSDLAREYGLGYDELVAANPDIDPWLPGEGTPILLPTQYVLPEGHRRGVVLNLAAKRLFYFPQVSPGEPLQVLTYPIGIGRVGWETPLGAAKVIAKATDPTWYVPRSVRQEHAEAGDPLPSVVPPGPDNPLGRHVLQLDMPGYLIHGTNKPYGVGMRVSHGCIRLYPENIERLYSIIAIGEPVTIVNEPYLLGRRDGELYFEGHALLEDDSRTAENRLQELFANGRERFAAFTGEAEQMRARVLASEARGIPVRVQQADGFEVYGRARIVTNTVEPDPDVPTLAEVRQLLDGMPEGSDADATSEGNIPSSSPKTERLNQ